MNSLTTEVWSNLSSGMWSPKVEEFPINRVAPLLQVVWCSKADQEKCWNKGASTAVSTENGSVVEPVVKIVACMASKSKWKMEMNFYVSMNFEIVNRSHQASLTANMGFACSPCERLGFLLMLRFPPNVAQMGGQGGWRTHFSAASLNESNVFPFHFSCQREQFHISPTQHSICQAFSTLI